MIGAEEHEKAKRTERAAGAAIRSVLEVPAGDVREAVALLERQETMLPYLDPTAWMRGGGKVTDVALQMMRALLAFREEIDRIRAAAGPEFYRDWLEFGLRTQGRGL